MIRLLKIEYYKLKHYRPFWVLGVLHFLLIAFSLFSVIPLLVYLENNDILNVKDFLGFGYSDIPFFDFVDIWQNITWYAGFYKFILVFMMIMSLCNDISYKTIRQNIIDGMSRREYLLSKLVMISFLALLSTLFLFVCGIILGFMYSPVLEMSYIVKHIDFLPAYFLELFSTMLYALLLALLIKRSGLTLILLLISIILEKIGIQNLPDDLKYLGDFLPMEAISNVIRLPFQKYFMMEVQDYISLKDLGVCLLYTLGFWSLSMRIMNRRDF